MRKCFQVYWETNHNITDRSGTDLSQFIANLLLPFTNVLNATNKSYVYEMIRVKVLKLREELGFIYRFYISSFQNN